MKPVAFCGSVPAQKLTGATEPVKAKHTQAELRRVFQARSPRQGWKPVRAKTRCCSGAASSQTRARPGRLSSGRRPDPSLHYRETHCRSGFRSRSVARIKMPEGGLRRHTPSRGLTRIAAAGGSMRRRQEGPAPGNPVVWFLVRLPSAREKHHTKHRTPTAA